MEDLEALLSEAKLSPWDRFTSFIWYRPIHKIKNLLYEIKYGFQRMFRGYDDREVFSLDFGFIDKYTEILQQFKENTVGYPPDISEQEWNRILDRMIFLLLEIQNMYDEVDVDNYDVSQEIIVKDKDEFFHLFSKYFFNLWY